MTQFLYNLLMRALQPWVRLRLRRRARHEPLYAHQIEQRFGHYGQAAMPCEVWIQIGRAHV